MSTIPAAFAGGGQPPVSYTFAICTGAGLTGNCHLAETATPTYTIPADAQFTDDFGNPTSTGLSDLGSYYWAATAEWEDDWWESSEYEFHVDIVPPVRGVGPLGWLGHGTTQPQFQVAFTQQPEQGVQFAYTYRIYRWDGSLYTTTTSPSGPALPEPSTSVVCSPHPDCQRVWFWDATVQYTGPGAQPGSTEATAATPLARARIVSAPQFVREPTNLKPSGLVNTTVTVANPAINFSGTARDPAGGLCLVGIAPESCRWGIGVSTDRTLLTSYTFPQGFLNFPNVIPTQNRWSTIWGDSPNLAFATTLGSTACIPFACSWATGLTNGQSYYWNTVAKGQSASLAYGFWFKTEPTGFTLLLDDHAPCPVGPRFQTPNGTEPNATFLTAAIDGTVSGVTGCTTVPLNDSRRTYRWTIYKGPGATAKQAWQSAWGPVTVNGNLAEMKVPQGVVENGTQYQYTLQSALDGVPGTPSARYAFTAMIQAQVPEPMSPGQGAVVPATTPTLTAVSGPSSRSAPIAYAFEVWASVATDPVNPDCGNTGNTRVGGNSLNGSDVAWTRGSAFSVPDGWLTDGRVYCWRVKAMNAYQPSTAWSSWRAFKVSRPMLGSGDWAMWSRGPASVNLKTGNLVVGVPGPSYPTAVGSMGVGLAYNSANSRDEGFGPGVTFSVPAGADDEAAPSQLVDWNLPAGGAQAENVVEITGADGSPEFFLPLADGLTFVPEERGGSVLRKRGPNVKPGTNPAPWTLTRGDGAVYTFGLADPVTGEAPLLTAQITASTRAGVRLVYQSDAFGRVTSVTDPAGRALTFNWGSSAVGAVCPDAIVCVIGPDQVTTKYVGEGDAGRAGPLVQVKNAVRPVVEVSWEYPTSALGGPDTSKRKRIASVLDANTIAAQGRGPAAGLTPGHNGTYKLAFGYADPVDSYRATRLTEGPITSAGSQVSSVWTLTYNTGGTTQATVNAHLPHIAAGQTRQAAGNTQITGPRHQGASPAVVETVWFDEFARPIQTRDRAGRTTQGGWSTDNLPVWSEDPIGAPTDTTYELVNKTPVSVQGPDPDGAGTAFTQRPESLSFYDEITPGTGRATGPVLHGVQAAYFDNRNTAGRPYAMRLDPTIDFDWGAGTATPLASLPSGPPVDNFSVRWNGVLDIPDDGQPGDPRYVFTAVADGGVRMTIDGVLVVDSWVDPQGAGPQTSVSEELTIAPGPHRVEVSYFDGDKSNAAITLKYRLTSPTTTLDAVLLASTLRPAYLNQTSTVGPQPDNRRTFSHYATPERGLPDDTLVKGPGGQDIITSFTYDDLGRTTSKTMPRGNAARTIDPATGNLNGTPDSRFTTEWAYYGLVSTDANYTAQIPTICGGTTGVLTPQAGGLREKRVPGLAVVTSIADEAGRPRADTRGRGTTCLNYDAEGRLTSSKTKAGSAQQEVTNYTYDPNGATRIVSTPAKGVVTTEYDEAGRTRRTLDSQDTPPPAPPGTAPADASAPTATLISPAAGGVTGTQVSVAATITDDIGVVGVQFKLDGVNLGSEDTRPPYRVLWDATQSGNGSHQLTAVARDASGKSTTSPAVAVTVTGGLNTAPAGLVAAYNFNEGTGTILTDRSTTGNTGTLINGPTWSTTGKYSGALQFDGVNDRVNTPDANSLDLTNRMTVEAWVNPSAGSAQKTIIEKENASNLRYGIIHDSSRRPQGRIYNGATQSANSGTALPTGTWTHLAVTFNGSVVTLYTNGGSPVTLSTSTAMTAGTGVLSIGGNTVRTGEWFTGSIDDMRIYNRSLSAAEITTDLNTALPQYVAAQPPAATIPAGDGATETTLVYDQEGNPLQRNAAPGALGAGQGHTVNYSYNADNSLATQEIRAYGATTAGDTYTYSYDTRGALKGIQYPGTVANSWRVYNQAGWLTGIYNRHGPMPTGTLAPDAPPAADLSPIADYLYDYAPDGHQLREQLRSDTAGSQTREYSYDVAGRLATYFTPAQLLREYRYDLDSNRTATLETPSGGAQASVATYIYDPGTAGSPSGVDQLTSKLEAGQTRTYSYNPDGELRTETAGVATVRDLSTTGDWDGLGWLSAGTYSGVRVATTRDPAGAIKARGSAGKTIEYLGNDFERTGGQVTQTTPSGPAGILVRYAGAAPTGTRTFVFFNGHGDVAAVTSSSGVRQGPVSTYDPFGNIESQATSTNGTVEGYLGQSRAKLDTVSGLITMGVRPYDPSLGRFLAVDPVDGGSSNNYDYARQEPCGNRDPSGGVTVAPGAGCNFAGVRFTAQGVEWSLQTNPVSGTVHWGYQFTPATAIERPVILTFAASLTINGRTSGYSYFKPAFGIPGPLYDFHGSIRKRQTYPGVADRPAASRLSRRGELFVLVFTLTGLDTSGDPWTGRGSITCTYRPRTGPRG